MKKFTLFLVTILFCLNLNAYAYNFKGHTEKIIIAEPEYGLKTGEKLKYSVEWLGVPIGILTLEVKESVKINNYDCDHITALVTPNQFFRSFLDLEYQLDSYIDTQSLYTRRFEKIRRFNKEQSLVVIDFNQEKNEVSYREAGSAKPILISPLRQKLGMANSRTKKIPKGTQDLISVFYYLRLISLKEEGSYPVNIYYDQRNWLADFKAGKPFLRDIRKKGTFRIFKLSPDSKLSGFILGKYDFFVCFTADPLRIPIEFKFNTAVGSIRGIIQDISR